MTVYSITAVFALYQRELHLTAIHNAQSYDVPRPPLTRARRGTNKITNSGGLWSVTRMCFNRHPFPPHETRGPDPGATNPRETSIDSQKRHTRYSAGSGLGRLARATPTTAQRFWNRLHAEDH